MTRVMPRDDLDEPVEAARRPRGPTTSAACRRDRRAMNRLHTTILAGGLLLSPVLLTTEELLRTTAEADYVENDADPVADAASQLQAVADHLPMWHAAAYVDLAYIFAWAIGLLAITIVVARVRPVL